MAWWDGLRVLISWSSFCVLVTSSSCIWSHFATPICLEYQLWSIQIFHVFLFGWKATLIYWTLRRALSSRSWPELEHLQAFCYSWLHLLISIGQLFGIIDHDLLRYWTSYQRSGRRLCQPPILFIYLYRQFIQEVSMITSRSSIDNSVCCLIHNSPLPFTFLNFGNRQFGYFFGLLWRAPWLTKWFYLCYQIGLHFINLFNLFSWRKRTFNCFMWSNSISYVIGACNSCYWVLLGQAFVRTLIIITIFCFLFLFFVLRGT